MSKFSEAMKSDPPRFVVNYVPDEKGNERFGWSAKHYIPILSLLGAIRKMQGDLQFRNPDHCDEKPLVAVYDPKEKKFSWFLSREIPMDPLVGMLEMIVAEIVARQMMTQMKQAASKIVGPDGNPIPGG